MRTLKYTLILIIGMAVPGLGAEPQPHTSATTPARNSVSVEEQAAVQAVVDHIKPHVHKTNRPLFTYHYVDNEDIGLPSDEPVSLADK